MNFGDRFVIEQYTKPSKDALQHDEEYCCYNQPANCRRLIGLPYGNCQDERYNTNGSTKKPVTVLEEKVPWSKKPFGKWKQEHVVPICSRPVWNSHGCLVRGNKRTKSEQHACCSNKATRNPMSHIWALDCIVFQAFCI